MSLKKENDDFVKGKSNYVESSFSFKGSRKHPLVKATGQSVKIETPGD
jgi:hypothetical protein